MAKIKILTTASKKQWEETLPAAKNVFGSVQFAYIQEEYSKIKAHLFVWSSSDTELVYPFYLRSEQTLPFESGTAAPMWDSFTPEFTGPIINSNPEHSNGLNFSADFSHYCKQNGIVAEFAHLHPWQSYTNALVDSSIVDNREIVYIDVTLPEEKLWQESFTYACRKNIRRAKNSDVKIFSAKSSAHIHEFHKIYLHTMERTNANEKYFFPLDFFLKFFSEMPNQAKFMLAEYQGQLIAGTLYLHDDTNVYSYLGGANHEFQRVRPSNAIVYETIQWARATGKKRLVLGGGYRENDGIFRFKSSFSPLRSKFQVYKRIHLPKKYDSLCSAWAKHYQTDQLPRDFFPAYRSKYNISTK